MAWGQTSKQKTDENGGKGISIDDTHSNTESLLEKKLLGTDSDPTCSSFASLPVPPDGGYGWVVCFGAFMCMIILDGMMFSFGVFFMDLLDSFGESKGKTALVGSTLMGTHLIVGPLTAVLVNLYDCRRVALCGCLIATVAFAGSTFSPNLDVLIVLYGIFGGIGVSMIYIPAILIVGFYFEKRRAIANGIANSGSGLGTFIYAPLSRYLLDEYSWRGALLILAGLVFNCAVCAALFRPLGLYQSSSSWKLPDPDFPEPDFEEVKKHLPGHMTGDGEYSQPPSLPQSPKSRVHQLIDDGMGKAKSQGDLPSVTLSAKSLTRRLPQRNIAVSTKSLTGRHGSHLVFTSSVSLRSPDTTKTPVQLVQKKYYVSKEILHRPLERKDAFYSGSISRLAPYQDPDVPFTLSMLRLPSPRSEDDDVSETVNGQTVVELLHSMLGLGLLCSPMFLMCIFMGVLWTAHSCVLSIFPDYAVLSGISRAQAALLVSIIGVSNIVGRLLAGVVSDRPGMDPVLVNACALILGSSVTMAIPFTQSYVGLGLEAGVFGLCMGAWTSLRPIILVELLGLDRLTNAFGLMAMFQGIAFTIGSPITGALFDYTQSYKVPFIVAGSAFLLSGIISILMRTVAQYQAKRQTELDLDADV